MDKRGKINHDGPLPKGEKAKLKQALLKEPTEPEYDPREYIPGDDEAPCDSNESNK